MTARKSVKTAHCLLVLMLGCLVSAPAYGIDFKISGEWVINFIGGQNSLLHSVRDGKDKRNYSARDIFDAKQRIRLGLEAIASENLSAGMQIQIGGASWGNAAGGLALGGDGTNIIKVRYAYVDWKVQDFNLTTRMGLQFLMLPYKAGGPSVMATRLGAVVSNYKINDNFSITGMWGRPYNDNYPGDPDGKGNYKNVGYLDNLDLFSLMLPIKFDGYEVTPWAIYGMEGRNTQWGYNNDGEPVLLNWGNGGYTIYTLLPYPGVMARGDYSNKNTSKTYANLFWAGLPISITAFDPWNIEFDVNYGYVGSLGRYNAYKGAKSPENLRRSDTQRQGWLAKGLVEYKFDWGIPGIFGWYATGDDSNPKNGSERMPSLVSLGFFTTFLGTQAYSLGDWYELSMDYSGTWGLGLQVKDIPIFSNDFKNTIRAAWWGGTNSPEMIKYMNTSYAWNDGWYKYDGPYLTTKDGLLELNMINSWQLYENFTIETEFGYIANFIDNNAWSKAGARNTSFSKQDVWKCVLKFAYNF